MWLTRACARTSVLKCARTDASKTGLLPPGFCGSIVSVMPTEPQFVVCRCQNCDGKIEFDGSDFAKGETRQAECPHCGMETVIFVPQQKVQAVIPPPLPQPPADALQPVQPPQPKFIKGTILDYAIQTNTGIISGDDGQRYPFQGADWREAGKFPSKGMRVDFTPQSECASAIYPIQDATYGKKQGGLSVLKWIVISLVGLIFVGIAGSVFLAWVASDMTDVAGIYEHQSPYADSQRLEIRSDGTATLTELVPNSEMVVRKDSYTWKTSGNGVWLGDIFLKVEGRDLIDSKGERWFRTR